MNYQFHCHILREIIYKEDTYWGVWEFTTDSELPHTTRVNNDYQDIKKGLKSTQIFQGRLNGNCTRLKRGQQFNVEAKVVASRSKNKDNDTIYHNYQIVKISPLMTTTNDKESFIKTICTKRQADSIIANCPNFIDLVIKNESVPKIKYIGTKSMEKIKKSVNSNFWINDILVWLTPLGITNKMIHKLADGNEDLQTLKMKIINNPYLLTRIKGLGFKRVDDLALKLNPYSRTMETRYDAFIKWFFKDIANQRGDTLISIEELNKGIEKYIPEFKDSKCLQE